MYYTLIYDAVEQFGFITLYNGQFIAEPADAKLL